MEKTLTEAFKQAEPDQNNRISSQKVQEVVKKIGKEGLKVTLHVGQKVTEEELAIWIASDGKNELNQVHKNYAGHKMYMTAASKEEIDSILEPFFTYMRPNVDKEKISQVLYTKIEEKLSFAEFNQLIEESPKDFGGPSKNFEV